ncbi:MAG: M3 family oligoendopeptidase [Fimbriimonas sp.]
MAVATQLPRWDMDVLFPGLESPEFEAGLRELVHGIDGLETLFNAQAIDKGNSSHAAFDRVVGELNRVMDHTRLVNGYVQAILSTDSRNQIAQARASEIDNHLARVRKLGKRFTAWVGGMDVQALMQTSELARDHEYVIQKAVVGAQKLMPSELESLASDLELTGKNAWSKLHANVTSQLTVPLNGEQMPMSAVRALAYDPDREVRRTAYEAELAAWKTAEVPLAAALNSIKGEVNTLCERRSWGSPLDEALYGANIDRETLDAMLQAARESFPDFRRYMNAKARALGPQKLAWYDLFSPLGGDEQSWEYDKGMAFVRDQFATYSQKMADYAQRNFDEKWIDVPPAPGKVDGAYCMGVRGDESRILMNYKPSYGSVSTLAHELGHGYHNLCLANRTWLQRGTPMTLAETASIFCETIIRQAVLEHGSPSEQLTVLEASLQGSMQVVVDITSRFLFEQSVFEQRRKRELSPEEMCELMLDAQRQTYGDGLDQEALHPYMWAVKGHYYSGRSYYNFPYMFGLLFGLGLYAIYKQQPNGFHERYDDLLSSTGLADAATLGQRFGIDIRSVEFWRGSLDQIRSDINRFENISG